MSRIGKKPVAIPGGVKVSLDTNSRTITIEGSKGKLQFVWRPEVSVTWDEAEKKIICSIPEDQMGTGQMRAYWGTTRARIQNMVDGVSKGFEKKLEVVGVGWNAKMQGKSLQLNVGFCHPVDMPLPQGLDVQVQGQQITISGYDRQAVGQFAAEVRAKRKPEPYKGKGIKYIDEILIRKQGTAFGA